MELPKSRSEPLNHVFRRGAGQMPPPSTGDDAGTPATGAHEPATPRSICEGACVRSGVAKEWACIVVSSVVRFRIVRSAPRGGKTKRAAFLSAFLEKARRARTQGPDGLPNEGTRLPMAASLIVPPRACQGGEIRIGFPSIAPAAPVASAGGIPQIARMSRSPNGLPA